MDAPRSGFKEFFNSLPEHTEDRERVLCDC